MKILMLTKFLPVPANSGGKQRSLAVLRRLAAAGDVTLCAFDDGNADHDALRSLGVEIRVAAKPGTAAAVIGAARAGSVSAGRFWSAALLAEALAAANQPPDILLVAYSQLAPYGPRIPSRYRVLDLHNIESALFASYAATATSPLRRVAAAAERAALARIERRAVSAFDSVIVVSETDARRLPSVPRRLLVCPNGTTAREPLPMSDELGVAFVGLLGWRPNIDAARWLTAEVWPRVRDAVSGVHLFLVGRDPAPEVVRASAEDVTVTGAVPSIDPYLARVRVAVAPLLAGGGSRLKILEALAAGRPVVSTAVGAEGLSELVGAGLTIADDPETFADEVVALLRDPERAEREGRAGSEAVRARYDWDRALAPLDAELELVRSRHH